MAERALRSVPSVADVHVLSVVHRVVDLRAAAGFAVRVLGLPATGGGPDHVVLDNQSISVRLISDAAADLLPPLDLELAVQNVEETSAALLRIPGVTVEEPARWTTETRVQAVLRAPHRFRLVLGREHNEDELGVTPPLPSGMPWDPEAQLLVQSLLKRVPVPFRANARRRVAGWIETLAARARVVLVDKELALRGLIQVTPKLDLAELRRELVSRGIEVERFAEDFARD